MNGNGRVIVIDNDEHVCRAAGQALMLAGYTTDCCNRAEDATEKISSKWPNVVVCDVRTQKGSDQAN